MTPNPPLKAKESTVLPPAVIIAGEAANALMEGGSTTVRVAWLEVLPPAPLTLRVYTVVAVGPTVKEPPLLSARSPGVTVPVPLENVPESWAVSPRVILPGATVKLEMFGGGAWSLPPPQARVRVSPMARIPHGSNGRPNDSMTRKTRARLGRKLRKYAGKARSKLASSVAICDMNPLRILEDQDHLGFLH
jgi:hypothetical protein